MSVHGNRTRKFLDISVSAVEQNDDGYIHPTSWELRLNGLELSVTFRRGSSWSYYRAGGFWATPWFLIDASAQDRFLCDVYVSGDFPADRTAGETR